MDEPGLLHVVIANGEGTMEVSVDADCLDKILATYDGQAETWAARFDCGDVASLVRELIANAFDMAAEGDVDGVGAGSLVWMLSRLPDDEGRCVEETLRYVIGLRGGALVEARLIGGTTFSLRIYEPAGGEWTVH